ncbi:thiamine pyrophosphate-binding protein [Acetivibrio straminisolvens]|jgi:acetolactate synthase-1/2/3 large subunit|uniref:Thiamine pyrophosphate-requiring enzymes n=1 Tax=Acetivibrio straminisolvens JCM 21531 TaxID=1294263 RepID=W4V0Y0_9FIRM|nr:thiamine pyrophosphate-binding protein [Acetivibrio straminisolvens]GAE86876.1 thiamine pyrophosphate-requiring enzymes [Acetivibrio straminisolvens JCM 21531]
MSKITGGELLVLALRKNNIKNVFGLVGNHVSPIFVHAQKHGLDIIDVRHEQAAIHMADGWSQVTRNIGVAIVTGGPGFTNSITGIVKAYMANTPILVIVGSTVPQQRDVGGLQDIDQIGMIREYTKWSASVFDTGRIPEYISIAMKKAVSGLRGPVVLEIPINILKNSIDEEEVNWPENNTIISKSSPNRETLDIILNTIVDAEKPLIIAGDEIYYGHSENELVKFVETTGIPIVTVNKARGCIPDSHSLCFGNGRVLEAGPQLYALHEADVIINVGLNIDYQMGLAKLPFFRAGQKFINICRDEYYNSRITSKPALTVIAEPGETLSALCTLIKEKNIVLKSYSSWIDKLKENDADYWENISSQAGNERIHPINIIRGIMEYIDDDDIVVLDGSNAMFWGSLLFSFNKPGRLIIGPDGTLGPMGCGIPLALAAKLANPDKKVILYTGDGSFGFNAIEMDTAVRLNIPITVIVHNDLAWGFCKSTQQVLYGEQNVSSCDLGIRPYEKMVEALGGYGEFVGRNDRIIPAIKNAIDSGKPACINVLVDYDLFAPGAIMFNESLKAMK